MSMIPVIQQKRFEQMDEFIRSISYGGELYHIFERGKFVFRGHASFITLRFIVTLTRLRWRMPGT